MPHCINTVPRNSVVYRGNEWRLTQYFSNQKILLVWADFTEKSECKTASILTLTMCFQQADVCNDIKIWLFRCIVSYLDVLIRSNIQGLTPFCIVPFITKSLISKDNAKRFSRPVDTRGPVVVIVAAYHPRVARSAVSSKHIVFFLFAVIQIFSSISQCPLDISRHVTAVVPGTMFENASIYLRTVCLLLMFGVTF